ncbi:hypothetical protein SanaruYs_39450 [Chryseotalea sanaruensis]|uniref:Uncharacterized protein n=1 Tax=Chryseotalea sanaruensis TaxID=2482724 RepID=A0A401UFS8_9BACT|nr:hypothetical protein [Chryseotalea sanaruensis]GCC53700.1 hypothetical protein SanaruYs_39450 [Chryseotalea sanaruensis]
MSYLVRKVNKAKWFQIDILKDDDVSADALTNCLKTTNNTLSVWRIDNEADLDSAILAIVANQDHLDTIDIVILEESSLEGYNINIVASPGETPVASLISAHRDLSQLTFSKIHDIKNHIVERIRNDKLKRYTVASLKKILNSAIERGLVKQEDLKESLRKKI